ncbi:hypothetical protein ACROYT_G029977 [Oculina patagonica]
MNNENSGEVDVRRENALTESSCTAVDKDGPEDLKPPDSKRFQLEMDKILERVREVEAKIKSLKKQVAGFGGKTKTAVVVDKEKLQKELQELRTQREKVIEERKQFDLELKGLNVQVLKKNDACTKLQAGVRFRSEARIDEAVRRLEHQMQAQQLKLSEEKRIVAEIDTLKRSKRNLNEYLVLKQHVDQLRNKQKHLRSQRDACVKKINGLKSREEEVKNLLDSDVSDESEEVKQQFEQLNEIEQLKTELDELHAQKRDLKANFTKERNDYYAAIREIKTQKQKEWSTKRKTEITATFKAVGSSRTTEQPYEKEKALCDTLVNHLERLHINAVHMPDLQAASSPDKEPALSLSASADFSLSGDKGMFLRRKSATDDLVGVYAGVARTSRRGSRKGRRSSAKEVPRKLNLHPEVVEHLLTLGLSPPSTVADIPKVLEELQEKKDFYESAVTHCTVLASANNDPMSPITEEAAPEFPSKFEESEESGTLGKGVEAENAKSIEENPVRENFQNNFHVTHDEISLLPREEEASISEGTELSDNFSDSLPEKENEVSNFDPTELVESTSGEDSGLSNADLVVSSGNCEVTLNDAAHFSAAHLMTEPNMEALRMTNGDLNDSDEVTTNCAESEKCTHTHNDKVIHADVDQLNSTKASTLPKESNFIPHLQSSTICAEQSSFNGPSTCSTNLLMEDNGLEVAYDRNSVNNGGGMVKIQCEKCPA